MKRIILGSLAALALILSSLAIGTQPVQASNAKQTGNAKLASDWKKAPGSLSPQYKMGSCIYRVWYGMYGNVGFAKVRFYSGDCDPNPLQITIQSGSSISNYHGLDSWSGGTDSCGGYFEKQTIGPANWIAIGETISVNGYSTRNFRYNYSTYHSVYNNC